jgi:adenylosuccinate synthase
MPVTVVVGVQWGDEGKGKIIDLLTEEADLVARYMGGANAGHTVVKNGRTYTLHLIPSGILFPDKKCVIGNGMVVDPESLLAEMAELERMGISVAGRLFISSRCNLIMPYHKVLDQAEDDSPLSKKIGTTGRGIGPAYSDKAQRTGIHFSSLYREREFGEKLRQNLRIKNCILKEIYGRDPLNYDEIYQTYMGYREKLWPFLTDIHQLIRESLEKDERILCEGAQGTMLDLDHGTYPFVTSSSSTAGGACIGLGLPPNRVNRVIGVMKAYTTRVGEGPFPTELHDKQGKTIRSTGKEYGATTGRPRRCGWLDTVVSRYAVELNGIDSIVLTKLDVLDQIDPIPICVGYQYGRRRFDTVPDDAALLSEVEPIYEEMEGWLSPTKGLTEYDLLPDLAKRYVERVSELVGTKIEWVSTGQDRNETIRVC